MKNLLSILLLALTLASAGAADVIYRVKIPFTTNPSATHTVTVNGTVLTFVAGTPAANQVQIGATAADTALAYYTHLQTNPYSGLHSAISGVNVTLFSDEVNTVVTASNSGGWGSITVTAETLTTDYPVVVPLVLQPAATREPTANGLVDAFAYATTTFPASAPALANFLDTTETQTATGQKTFQNSANLYDGGRATNWTGAQIAAAWLGSVNISGDVGITNTLPRFIIYDSDASANEKYSVITAGSGEFQINLYNDAFSSFNTAFQIRRTGNTVDEIYFGAPLDVADGATFNGTVTAPIISSTNLTGILRDANVFAQEITSSNIWLIAGSGNHFAITNADPAFRWYESDEAADNRLWDWIVDGGVMKLRVRSDDGAFDNTIFQITRDSYNGGTMAVYADVSLLTLSAIGATINGPLTAQDSTFTFATLPYLKLTNAASLGVDPTLGVYQWATGGELRYRQVGSGVDHYAHNLSAEYVGAGTDHTFGGTSYTQLAFGSGGNVITLPSAGTYFIYADLAVEAGGVANETFAAKFYNATSAADITNSERQVSNIAASKRGQLFLYKIVTVTTGTTIHVYVKNSSSAAGAVDSVETKLGYARMF
jgi:hypothetical protein